MKHPTKKQAALCLLAVLAVYGAEILFFGTNAPLFVYSSGILGGTALAIAVFLVLPARDR
jgi:hypothetical protein